MFLEGGQTRKHYFQAMFCEGGQTRKHCFLPMFPEDEQTRKHPSHVSFFVQKCFLVHQIDIQYIRVKKYNSDIFTV
jgi:hypothetical protein